MLEQLDRFVREDRDLITTSPGETALQAARKMAGMDVGCLLVLDQDGELVGVVTEKDIVHKVISQDKRSETIMIGEIMTTSVVTCPSNYPVFRAGEMMARRNIRHLPITKDGKVVGMVSSRDIIAHEITQVQKQAQKRYEDLCREKQETS